MSRPKGFTKGEMVFVAIVVGSMLAMLAPTLVAYKKRDNQLASMRNLRQWGIALNLSLADTHNTLPSTGSTGIREPEAWCNTLPLYLSQKSLSELEKNKRLPSPLDKTIWVNPGLPPEKFTLFPTFFSYAMNPYLRGHDGGRLRITKLDNPSSTVFMAEVACGRPAFETTEIVACYGPGSRTENPSASAHFLFCDGHVELVPRSTYDAQLGAPSLKADPPSTEFSFIPYNMP